MNLRKLFSGLILGVVAFNAFACILNYDDFSQGGEGGSAYIDGWSFLHHRRYFYLSGINTPGNHISGITCSYVVNSSNGDPSLEHLISYTAANHVAVSLPLTVYVGVADICAISNYFEGLHPKNMLAFGEEYEEITIIAQYRVMPEATWHTAAVKKFATGKVSVLSKQKIFGSLQIDCEASPGSTVLVRLYVAANKLYSHFKPFYNYLIGGEIQTLQDTKFVTYIENADPDSLTVDSSSDIAATETYQDYVGDDGTFGIGSNLQPSLRMVGWDGYGGDWFHNKSYLDGWTPQFVMAVTVGNKRRPGK